MPFETDVFINCPFDDAFAPLLEALSFCVTYAGLTPRLATERLEAGQNRLDKIFALARGARFSVHDLSRCRSAEAGEFLRMNMPFELGLDLGIRRSDPELAAAKRFLIFERDPYDTKRALSDLAGQDVEWHRNQPDEIIRKTRNFLWVEAERDLPGAARIGADYVTFQEWMVEKKLTEGHSERDALRLPTRERLEEMRAWMAADRPAQWRPVENAQ